MLGFWGPGVRARVTCLSWVLRFIRVWVWVWVRFRVRASQRGQDQC